MPMTENKLKHPEFDDIAADIEAGLESESDDRFWECAEHLLGEMHKNRRILEIASNVEAERQAVRLPMDPVDRLKKRIHDVVYDLSDLPEEERQDLFTALLHEIETRMGPPALVELMQLAGSRQER